MKKLAILSLSLICFNAFAQEPKNSFQPYSWEIGWLVSDATIGAFSADVVMGLNQTHSIGIRNTFTEDYFNLNYQYIYDYANYVYRGGIFHKMYIPTYRNRSLTLRHGLRYEISEYSLSKEEWIGFQNNGNTQYRLGERIITDQNIRMGYELIAGLQAEGNTLPFFIEYYLGLSYMRLVSTNSTEFSMQEIESGSNDYTDLYPSDHLRVLVGVVIGIKWKN